MLPPRLPAPTDAAARLAAPTGPSSLAERVVQALPWGVLVLDRQGGVVALNASAARLLGLPPAPEPGELLSQVLPPDYPAELRQALHDACTAAEPLTRELLLPARQQWLQMTTAPGETEILVYWQDITPLRHAEEARQAAQARTANILESTTDAFYALDAAFNFTYVNHRAAQRWGRDRHELLGQYCWTALSAAVDSYSYQQHYRALQTGQPVHYETVSSVVGTWIEVSIYPGSQGGLSVYFRDITARKQEEAARRLSEERQTYLLRLSDALRPLNDPVQVQATAARLLGEQLGVDHVHYVEVHEATQEFVVPHDWHRPGTPSHARRYPLAEWAMPWLVNGQPWVAPDMATDPVLPAEQLPGYQEYNIRAAVVVPLLKQGQLVAMLVVNQRAPRAWTPPEVTLVEETAERTWAAVARARAEAALRASEAAFRTIADAAPALVWVCDAQGSNVYFNQRWYAFTGQTAATAAGYGWMTPAHPADAARMQPYWERCQQTGEVYEGEVRYRRHDGAYRWHHFRALPRRNAQGVIETWYGVSVDIHDAKLAQEALRESEQKYRSLFETMSQGFSLAEILVDEAGRPVDYRLLEINPQFERLTGQPREAYLGGRTVREVAPELEEEWYAFYGAVGLTGVPAHREIHAQVWNRWFEVSAYRTGDPAQRRVAILYTDITARKLAEQARIRSLRLLEQAEAVAGLGSWDYDLTTRQFTWSTGLYQLLELTLGHELEPSRYLEVVVDEDQPRAAQLVRQLTTGASEAEETLRLRVGDVLKTVRLKVLVLRNEQGQAVRVLGVGLDISERQRLEADNLRLRLSQQQALFEAVQAAQEAERRRIAEGLHNGIGQILYATKLRLDQLHAPLLDTAPALISARREADQLLAEAIRQTRTLSHELVPLVLEDFGLAAAFQDIVHKLNSPQLRLHAAVDLDAEAGPLAPPLQLALYRMAQELVQNIIRHAPGATEASLELETVPGWVLLRVEDNGPGFTTNPATSSGLGLRSIRDRVALLGGTLEMGHSPVAGTYVRLRLPLGPPPAGVAPKTS